MLLHIFIIFSLIYSISSGISCYDCSLTPDRYTYIINSNNIPTEIQNCTITGNHTRCSIDIQLYLTTNTTSIHIIPNDIESLLTEHTLRANAIMSGFGVIQQMQHSLYYFCSTDKCNNANIFKRLLESLTINNKFLELEYLLEPNIPFNGNWCLLYANETYEDCHSPIGIDKNTCKQCLTKFTIESTMNKICATCFTNDIQEEYLGKEVLFNMIDRRRIENGFIRCRSPNCNGVNTSLQIRDKCDILFDFDKFLGFNISHRQTISSYLFTITLIIIGFTAKIFD